MVLTVVMVAEKPSICNSIAHALCAGSEMDSRGRSPPVHEFNGRFESQPARYWVTSVTGHVFSTDFPGQYQNWETTDPVDLFHAPTVKTPSSKGIVHHLANEGKGADVLVLWLDCDREGENICFEVIECMQGKMKPTCRILRARFSAVTPSDIKRAMESLGEPNLNEAQAVDARQELDLKVGVAFSRFQTRYFQGKYGDLDSTLVSYGPCQTPTLGFCVQRHDEIQSFSPERFWAVAAEVCKDAHNVKLQWDRGRVFDQDIATIFLDLVRGAGAEVTVEKVHRSEQRRTKPTPMNTVEMLKEASKVLGMGPAQAMHMAERLYLSGYLSYPRTESTAYPSSFDLHAALAMQASHPVWGEYVKGMIAGGGVAKPRAGVDVGDHPPITPCRPMDSEVMGDMARLYELVARHFIATLSHDARFTQTTVTLSCGEEAFTASGRVMIDPGYLAITLAARDEARLPEFTEGERLRMTKLDLREGQTSAPGYLTEAELIGLMEKHGIGTDASISTHINNICERNYVRIAEGRTLVPQPLGIVLVHGYLRIDPDLVLPKVRAAIESQCTLIAKGQASLESVVAHSLHNFEAKFRYFRDHIHLMDSLFEVTFSPLAATGKPLSKCGKCRRFMKYVHLKPQRLHCPTCNETYSLPQNGTIKLYKELKCPLDSFELLLFSLGNSESSQGKSFPLCPYCYNHPPFEGVSKMGCDSCLHPTCKHSMARHGVCACPGEQDVACPGTLVLDVNSRPHWKMSCNRCNNLVRFHADIHHIETSGEHCDACGSALLRVDFHKDKSLLPNGQTKLERACVMCDELLASMTEIRKGRMKHVKVVRQEISRRGGGLRGRGRGRGRRRAGNPLMSFSDF